jgi:hypothetical protein
MAFSRSPTGAQKKPREEAWGLFTLLPWNSLNHDSIIDDEPCTGYPGF